jgi:hypothetical protein
MPNQDERRAKSIAFEEYDRKILGHHPFLESEFIDFEQKWAEFLKHGYVAVKPIDIAKEFIKIREKYCPNCGQEMTPSVEFDGVEHDGEAIHYTYLCGCGYSRKEW